MGSTAFGGIAKKFHATDEPNVTAQENEVAMGRNAVKAFSGTRILFGLIFLFDGILKWQLIATNQMQGAVGMSNFYNIAVINNNWLAFGVLVGLGETIAGIGLLLGLFQKPSALIAAVVMFFIWGVGGYGGAGYPGYTDPGGDLMLALIFVALVFAPTAYGLASRFRLPEKLAGPSIGRRLLRFLIA